MADDNIKLIEVKNDCMWFEGSPIIICAFRLAVDMNTGDMFTSAKFLNIMPNVLRSITFDIICYDQARNPICHLTDITFRNLDVHRNNNFGYHRKIEINDLDTRNVEYVIKSTSYDNGQVWNNTENDRFNIKIDQESIYTVQGDCNRQFRDICARSGIEGMNLVLQPVFTEDYWLCACGAFNWSDEPLCSQCSVNKAWLQKNTDINLLRQRKEYQEAETQRIRDQVQARESAAAESSAAERMEFEQRDAMLKKDQHKAKMNRLKKNTIWVTVVLLIIAAIIFCLLTFVFPDFLKPKKSSKNKNEPSGVSVTINDIPGSTDII